MLMRIVSSPERAFCTAELAEEFRSSHNRLAKIMQRLAWVGLVETRRGRGGGATLTRPAEDIGLGARIRTLEDGQPMVECFGVGDCALDGRRRLKSQLRSTEAAFLADLDRAPLAAIALTLLRAA